MNEPRAQESLPITIRGVTKTYGPVFALDHVDLDVHSGEFLMMIFSIWNKPSAYEPHSIKRCVPAIKKGVSY